MKKPDVIQLLKDKRCGRPVAVFAKEIGVSGAYLYDVLNGRNPGPSILRYLGLASNVTREYVRVPRRTK